MRTAIGLGCLVLVVAWLARADQVLDLSGSLAEPQGGYASIPFEVPAGVAELEVEHEGLDEQNTLDFGLLGPDGFRCCSGSSREPSVTGALAASRSCLTGPLAAGTWRVVVGFAWIERAPAPFRLRVQLRERPTLAPQPERTPYASAGILDPAARWYAGDLHVHSRHSDDAQPSLEELCAFGRLRGLDFLAITDHNQAAQLELMRGAQAGCPDLLFIPGEELTTYRGHANALGISAWVNPFVGLDGRTIQEVAADARAQGALVSINHPTWDLGSLCLGCAWAHDLAVEAVDAVEVCNGDVAATWPLFGDSAIAFWDALCARGRHLAALGGSDAHRLPAQPGGGETQPGTPTTLVYAEGLGVGPILEGIRRGRTVVKLRGPDGPMILLASEPLPEGDTVRGTARLAAEVQGGLGHSLRWVLNGRVAREQPIDAEPFRTELEVEAPTEGEARVRVEVRDAQGMPLALTSHLWIAPPPRGGGGCASASSSPNGALLAGLMLLARWWLRRRLARPARLKSGAGSSYR
jgi:hypothetical protein